MMMPNNKTYRAQRAKNKKSVNGLRFAVYGLLLVACCLPFTAAAQVTVGGNVYGGGNLAAVSGNSSVTLNQPGTVIGTMEDDGEGHQVLKASTGDVFGGGNAAGVSGTASVTLTSGKVTGGLYGGCNTEGTVGGNITVALNGGTVGVNGTTTDVVYGGGFGHSTATGGDIAVTLNGTTVYGNLYGGSALGSVNGSSSNTTTVTIGGSGLNGKIFGGGMGSGTAASTQATTLGNVTVNYNTANANLAGIYGGANVNGDVAGDINVNIEANVGATGAGNSVDIFGGGLGQNTTTDGDVTVTIGNSNTPTIYGDVYGGSGLGEVSANGKLTKVDFKSGTLNGTIYGGGMGQASPAISATVSGDVEVAIAAGTITTGVYGGCNERGNVVGDITVDVTGSTIGANGSAASVFGGGYGANTTTGGDVLVNINGAGVTVWGDVYGGSGLGNVNDASSDYTTVNILNGEVKGDIFGGGLGDTTSLGLGHYNYAAKEYGVVTVNIGNVNPDYDSGDPLSEPYLGNATIGGNVYGCNNTYGSPQDTVVVNIYKTAHTTTPTDNTYSGTAYAIRNVFGGGKKADYTASKRATVNVYTCDNTIDTLYGGGDAAAVTGSKVVINGGRFNYVFGGGNGAGAGNPGADIGSLGITLDLHGGTIGTLVSASNEKGDIDGSIKVNVDHSSSCDEEVTDFFGGANMVDIATDVTTTIECGAGTFRNVYGGSNKADIDGNVSLTIQGGTIGRVFGGSKGDLSSLGGGHSDVSANITGNVTLTLNGGSIGAAFGGSNINGTIDGTITVNVNDLGVEGCELEIDSVFGAGNLTAYNPTTPGSYPAVNIINGTVNDVVFGGGKQAAVTSSPVVTIGDNTAAHRAIVTGSVFGGGDAAAVTGNTTVTYNDNNANSYVGNIYGGGNAAGITGSTQVTLTRGRVTNGIYGGCNSSGTVTGNSTVDLLGGQVGTSSNSAVVFGGGYGQATNIDGNVHVTMGNIAGTANPVLYADIYGGSALGNVNTKSSNVNVDTKVNNTNTTTLDILSGVLDGNIYGGGLGQRTPSAIAPLVHGMVQINIGRNTGTNELPEYTGFANLQNADIYGCNNVNGSPQNDVHIDVYATAHPSQTLVTDTTSHRSYAIADLYGGGNAADYAPENGNASSSKKTYIHVYGCDNTIGELFGGGNAAAVVGDSVFIEGGRFNEIFGGGNGAVAAANVGKGGIHLNARSGRVGYIFEQCNKRGEVNPDAPIIYKHGGGDCNNGILQVDYHFCGGNIQDVYGDSVYTFTCSDKVKYMGLYGGCRLGRHYGNITLVIEGGTIGEVYGGSMGMDGYSADVRKYPSIAEVTGHEEDYPEGILTFLNANENLQHTGGNVTVIIKGGDIGSVFGGCNVNGNVEGRITVIIDSTESDACPLDLDYVYGGGNVARYIPDTTENYNYPYIQLKKGHVNQDVFGGGHGSETDINAGIVTSNPHIVMAPEGGKFWVKGNIYGGGEMASVGRYTRDGSGKPTACAANTGHTTIEISAGKVGPAVLKMPDYSGHVFGGSKGAVGDTTSVTGNPKLCHIAYVNTSDVTISGTAFIKGSVYGGGESGRIFDSTYVKIQGGQIGCGWNDAAADDAHRDLNRVYTDAEWLYDVTSDNTKFLYECNHWTFGNPSTGKYDPYDPYEHPQAYDGHTFYGNVFGGGSGMMPYKSRNVADDNDSSIYIQTAGRVIGNTRVEITGGHILTNIYGGCELGDVLDTCTVIFHGGTLGVPRTLEQIAAHPVTCYLFGAGKGDERVRFNTRTNVNYVRVTVDGGKIYGSVFGGGEDGHVMRDVQMDIKHGARIGTWGTSYVDGNVFGGGRGFSGNALTAGNVGGDIDVDISGGTMLGSIYGGGRLASVGYGLYPDTDTNYGVMRPDDKDDAGNTVAGFSRGHITVNISGNTVIGNDVASDYSLPHSRGGNVFGGSMGRLTKLDATMVLPLWHRLGCAKATTVNIRGNVHVKGNVYGGSELGRVTDSITVNISGNVTVGRKAASTTTSHGNVYGGGVGHGELTAAEKTQVGNAATSDSIPTFAGLTGGTIKVNISGGAINNNVYGAGELASVGTIATVTKHTEATTYFLSWPYEYTYNGNSGEAQVNITGGTIGFISGGDTTGGNIYGSARGTVGDRYVTGRLATARRTQVNIDLASNSDKIIGDVYGSGENGHVYESATVTLTNGLVLGNVFGGGKGVDTYTYQLKRADESTYDTLVYDIIAGKVFGNTEVNILGGRVAKNVYGGGNLASVGIGNYKGYGEATGTISSADSLLAENSGHCYVNILGGVIGPDSITAGTVYNHSYSVPDGNVYGAGKGIVFPTAPKVGFDYDRDYFVAYVNKTFVIIGDSTKRSCDYKTVLTPHVTANVFGGGENGHVRFDTYVQTNRGIVGVRPLDSVSSDVGHWAHRGNVWGAGRGEDKNGDGTYCQSAGSVTRNTTIDILGARIYRNVQGGGAMASVGAIKGRTGDSSTCVINVRLPLDSDTIGGPGGRTVTGHTAEKSFGGYIGGGSRGIPSPNGTDNSALTTCHNSQINFYRGRLKNTIYGGGENGQMLGNTEINVYGGYIRSAIYGGGKGSWKAPVSETGDATGDYTNDTLSGYIVGNTTVNLLGGQVPFTYGGCRRASIGGNATINIGEDNGDGTYSGDASFIVGKDKVYGGNQYAGSPRGNIYVNVYKTAHTTTDAATYTEDDGVNGAPTYAINYVYGGSYNSPYLPKDSGHYAQVHVYGCDNTINEVYGGCASANVGSKPGIGANTKLIIDGGRFNNVFGGGDGTYDRYLGTSVPANIYGAAITEIHGGTFGSLYGGSNYNGNVDTIRISVDNSSGCGNVEGDEFFGGSNVTDLGPIELSATLGCGVVFNAAYGGSNMADITGNVTFNIQGGTLGKVFGGSKGRQAKATIVTPATDTAIAANIDGNVTLNATGGTLGYVYGGSNLNGNITGTITVNIDSIQSECPLTIENNVYGGSYVTMYNPTGIVDRDNTRSPVVNIKHGTIGRDTTTAEANEYKALATAALKEAWMTNWKSTHGNVFGGGHGQGSRTISNPTVYIGNGNYTTGIDDPRTTAVEEDTIDRQPVVMGNVYGGGAQSRVFGNTRVDMLLGTVEGNIFGACKGIRPYERPDLDEIPTRGIVDGWTTVNMSGGTVHGNLYGGGEIGSVDHFTGENSSTWSRYSSQSAENQAKYGNTYVNVTGGTVGYPKAVFNSGDSLSFVYGGGKGQDSAAYKEYANVENTYVIVSGGLVSGSVFGGAEDGHVLGNTNVIISNTVADSAYHAAHNDVAVGTVLTTPVIGSGGFTHEFDGCVLGGGLNINNLHRGAGRVQGNTYVTVTGGRIRRSVFGGGAKARVGVGIDGKIKDYDADTLYFHDASGDYDSTNHGSTFVEVCGTTDTVLGVRKTRYNYAGKAVADSLGFTDPDSIKYKNYLTTTYCIPGTDSIVVFHTTIGGPDDSTLVDNDYTIGDIFGGGKGDSKDTLDIFGGRVMNTNIWVHGSPRIMADIYAGGEMSCIGWYDTGTNATVVHPRDAYYENTGYTRVEVSGSPYTGTPFEFSETNIHGGRAWTLIDSTGRLYHTCSGNIYGGGQGYVEEGYRRIHNWVQMGRVRETHVIVNGGRFLGNVFGGGSRGIVKEDCNVTINGGTFGCIITDSLNSKGDKRYAYGSIFGGGYGNHKVFWHYNDSCFVNGTDTIKMRAPEFAGRVYGNTILEITGGHIMGNVYGGGDMASTGWVERDDDGKFLIHDSTAHHNGLCTVIIRNDTNKTTGAVRIPVIGPLDHTLMNGHVYGGGKGVPIDPKEIFKTYCNVNETHLTVSGGHIHGSTFGGGADCHVLGHTRTYIHRGAYIGSDGYTEEYDGCVFGGGRNAKNSNGTAGRVQGHTFIIVDGGRIQRTILGGGALARTGVDTNGRIDAFIEAGLYDSIHHGSTNIKVSGTDTVVLASEMNSDYNKRFKGTTTTEGVEEGKVRLHHTTIGAPNGPILVDNDYTIGDIFGGGKGDTKDTVDILAGKVMNTYVKVSGSPRIMADVYAGGEMSCIGWYDTTGANTGVYYPKTGYTHVEISGDPRTGTPYEFSCANIHYGRPWTLIDSIGRLYHTCSGNVYGGGQGYVEEDGTHRWNWVQMGRVYQTDVKIHGGHFMGNVFGGGSRGIVKKDCYVTITGGTFGNHIVDDTTIYKKIYDTTFTNNEHTEWSDIDSSKYDTLVFNNRYNYGSIFGGGYGNHKTFWHYNDSCFVKGDGTQKGDTIFMQPLEFAGRVYGNTHVKITGGHIMDCVFGGGDLASTGWVERDANGIFQFNDPDKRHGGVCNVEISGNTIVGPLDYFGHNAYVYAAGRGVGYDPTEEFKTYCNVNEAHLIVALTEGAAANLSDEGPDHWDTTTMGGRIWGSLFGGGADSHVLDSVSVVVHSGLVGTQGTTSYDGNIFGGGRNYLNTNHTNGRVQGNIRVFVDGGTLQGTIFGGGRLALSGIDTAGHFIDSTHGNVDILVRGDVVIGNHTADSLLKSDESCGDIFGSGKGDVKNYEDVWAGRVTNSRITVKDTVISAVTYSPRIYGSIFGGGEMASLGYWDDTITDGEGHVVFHTDGTGGTDYGVMYENTGRAVINLSGNLTLGSALEYTVAPYKNPGNWTIYESTATDTTLIHTCTGNVFGGGQGDVDPSAPRWVSMGRSASSVVNISGGTYYGNVYGGSEQGIVTGDTRLIISGGNFGYTGQEGAIHTNLHKVYTGDIYAAGYGSDDPSDNAIPYEYDDDEGHHSIANPINDSTADSETLGLGWTPDVLAGRTYGNARAYILGGHIHGSVYGGGSFASVGYELSSAKGNTYVYIGINDSTTVKASNAPAVSKGNATIDGEVFGANNFSGTPYGNTEVHIYKTAHTNDPNNTAPTAEDTKALVAPPDELTGEDVEALPHNDNNFALSAVYGGGNKAAHTPTDTIDGTTLVHVHYCEENTIRTVYGGGNAASTRNNHIIIDGGYIYEVFGGGNGAGEGNPGADVSGTAWTEIKGGLITDVFGGSNSKGNIGNTRLDIDPDGTCDIMVANTYGGSNEADGGGGEVNLMCGTNIGTFYGGSRKANLVGDITLNVYGGTYENIFGGSQGTPEDSANITGNVTLNFYGGNVQHLFGGSDVNGNISGTVLVNVDIDPDYDCPDGLRLDNVYGAGRDAAYTPYDPYRGSPTVNVMNNRYKPAGGSDSAWVEIQDVFGGGLGATATATSYPRVIIGGFEDGSKTVNETPVTYHRAARIFGNAYGGGSMAPVKGNTYVLVRDAVIGRDNEVESFTSGNLFGGGYGSTSKVMGDTYVGVFGLSDIKSNVYGGGNAGIVTGNTEVVVGYQKQVIVPEFIAYLDETRCPGSVRGGFHSTTPNVHFRYTKDGSIPTTTHGDLYTTDVLGDHDTAQDFCFTWGDKIQMIAYLWDGADDETSGHVDSSMIPSIVGFDRATAPIITFKEGTAHVGDPDSATFGGSVGSRIYYTLNGSEPTATESATNFLWGTVREAPGRPKAIGDNDVVKAFAVQRGCFNSEVSFLTADAPTVDNGTNTNIFTVTAKPGERIIYTLGTTDIPTPISLMNPGQRPGQGPGESGMEESTDDAPGHTATASDGSTVTHMKRVYTNSKGETVTYRWNEVTAATSGNTTVTITVPGGSDCTVKAIVEHAGYAPSNIGAAVYRH